MDRYAIEQHQHLGIAQSTHLGLMTGGVGLGCRYTCEVQTLNIAQQLVQRLRA